MEPLCCQLAAPMLAGCNSAARAEGTGKASAGEEGCGATRGNLGTKRPLSSMVTTAMPRPPPSPAQRLSDSLPATTALSLQEALAALWLVSHLVDGSVTAQSRCSWRGSDGGRRTAENSTSGSPTGLGLGSLQWAERSSVSLPGLRETCRKLRRHPIRDPRKWGILLMGLSFGRCLLFLEVGWVLAAGDCILG